MKNDILYCLRYLKDSIEDRRNYNRAKALSKKKTKILNEIESGLRPRSDIELYKHYDRCMSRVLGEMDNFLIKYYVL